MNKDYIVQGMEQAEQRTKSAAQIARLYSDICAAEVRPYKPPHRAKVVRFDPVPIKRIAVAVAKCAGVVGAGVLVVKTIAVGGAFIFAVIEANAIIAGAGVVVIALILLFRSSGSNEQPTGSKAQNGASQIIVNNITYIQTKSPPPE